MESKIESKVRRWTLGLALWFLTSSLASVPAWAAIYVHRNWNDNSLFEMASHTQWHFAIGMICIVLLDLILRWWCRWRAPIASRILHAAILLVPTVYLSSVTEPWTALPVHQFYGIRQPTKPISIASWNVFIQNHEFETIQKTIESLDADIVLLIEVTPEHQKSLSRLSKSYRHVLWAPRTNTQGLAILSRIPGTKLREVVLGKSQMLALEATVPAGKFSDQPIRLLGVHTASPNQHGRFRIRDEQLQDVAKWVEQSASQTIVIGDLNITPWSPGFQDFLKRTGLVDTRRFRGFFATWPCGLGIAGIPIDHALVSQGLKIIDRECGFPTIDADHQWIRTTVETSKGDRNPRESEGDNDRSAKAP